MIDWLLRSRKTGRITLFQVPNLPLAVYLVAAVIRRLLHPAGRTGTGIAVVATSALIVWAIWEIARGVNPFRRVLGGVVLAVTIGGLVVRYL